MKVAFDEDIPIAMVRVFQAFARENQFRKLSGRDLTIVSASDYVPKPGDTDHRKKDDSPWIRRFAKSGGKVVITADSRMMSVPHERLALIEEGLVVVFFEKKWNNWKFWKKCALLLLWWPVVVSKLARAKPGSFWRVPSVWDEKATLKPLSNQDPQTLRLERKLKRPRNKKPRPNKRPPPKQVEQTDSPRFEFWKDDKAEKDAKIKPSEAEGPQVSGETASKPDR